MENKNVLLAKSKKPSYTLKLELSDDSEKYSNKEESNSFLSMLSNMSFKGILMLWMIFLWLNYSLSQWNIFGAKDASTDWFHLSSDLWNWVVTKVWELIDKTDATDSKLNSITNNQGVISAWSGMILWNTNANCDSSIAWLMKYTWTAIEFCNWTKWISLSLLLQQNVTTNQSDSMIQVWTGVLQ